MIASGTGLTYQWYKNGVAISGATASSYSPPAPAATDSGTAFSVSVNNASNLPASSTPAVLYVHNSLSLIAGKLGGLGHTNGTGAAASFYEPGGVATDSSGNIYVADQDNHIIREITPAGVVTTVAGTPGTPGTADGACASASFNNPTGVAVDASGNLFVADSVNDTIRKIVLSGCTVSTFAGTPGVGGYTNTVDGTPQFRIPTTIAVDTAGNVYVADSNNHVIRKITSGGTVTTLAGSGSPGSADATGTAASFNYPQGVAVDASGNVYVADSFNSTIRKITAGGAVTTIAGTAETFGSNDGTGAAAAFNTPTAVALDSTASNLYVADSSNYTVRKVTLPGAVVTTIAGTAGVIGDTNATGTAATFAFPVDVAVDTSGNLYVADADNNLIRKVVISSAAVTTLAGFNGRGFANGAGSAAQFSDPHNIAADSAGNIYVADRDNNVIRKITAGGIVTTFVGSPGVVGSADGTGSAASFNGPFGMVFDSQGNLYVSDSNNDTIRKITPAGVVSTFVGTAGIAGSADGLGAAAHLNSPYDLAVDASDNLYLTDYGNNTVRKITSAGVVTTLAGTAGVTGSADGTGPSASFNGPHGIGALSNGNLLVTDRFNDTIRLITAGGVVTTVAGSVGVIDSNNGNGSAAHFYWPGSLSIDNTSGTVYITDYLHETIRVMTASSPYTVTTLAGTAGVAGTVLGALPGVLSGPSSIVFQGNTTTHLAISDSLENSIVLVTP